MNILVLFKNNGNGGLTTNTKSLVEGLKKRNINVIAAGCDGVGTRNILKNIDINIIDFQSKNLFKTYLKLSKLIKENNIDIIHCQNRIPALFASIYCFFNKSTKYVWANHQVPIPSDIFHRLTTKYGECAIAGSLDGKKMLLTQFKIPEGKVKLVNLGCDINNFEKISKIEQNQLKENLGIEKNEKVLFLYGRLAESKGHIFFLDALSKVKTNVPYKIIFPGDKNDNYKKTIMNKAKEYGIKDKIIFPGFIEGKKYLSISDLMVLPSKYEGYPISVIESFSIGVPVIRTKVGGYEDTKEYCFGVDFGDVDEFSKLIQDFFDNGDKYRFVANKALENKYIFSEDRMINDYINIYKEIL